MLEHDQYKIYVCQFVLVSFLTLVIRLPMGATTLLPLAWLHTLLGPSLCYESRDPQIRPRWARSESAPKSSSAGASLQLAEAEHGGGQLILLDHRSS